MATETGSNLAADLARARGELESGRKQLLQSVSGLSDSDLRRARRGQWDIGRILQHVLESERLYVAGLAHLQGQPQPAQASDRPEDLEGLLDGLETTRKTALELLEGASEETFYELRPLGHEEYSVFSLLENVALHDREHGAQIDQIMAES